MAAGLGVLGARLQRSSSWVLMSGILVFLALGTGATAQRALWFGTVFGAISLLFWEPGWRLGDWLDQRRHIRAG